MREPHRDRGSRDWYQLQIWRKRAKAQLRAHPLCAMCMERLEVTPATLVDHIEPVAGDWNRFRLGAVQSLCAACHNSRKRMVELHGYSREIGLNGYPVDRNHPFNKG